MAFDRTRYDWYPTVTYNGVLFNPATVSMSNGTPRPALAIPLKTFTVHYGGAGTWLDSGDTALELAAIERNHAIPNSKPNEYNSASDSDGTTWEWAGRFRAAHSEGENDTAWGNLVVLGLEMPTEAQADKLIAGIRKARRQAVAAGYITPDHAVVPHQLMPGANTGCPGPLYTNKTWWNRIAAPLTTTPTPQPQPPITGDETMLVGYVKHPNHVAVYRQFSNGTKTWITDGKELAVHTFINGGRLNIRTMPSNAWMKATGVIVGPIPAGVNIYGVPA